MIINQRRCIVWTAYCCNSCLINSNFVEKVPESLFNLQLIVHEEHYHPSQKPLTLSDELLKAAQISTSRVDKCNIVHQCINGETAHGLKASPFLVQLIAYRRGELDLEPLLADIQLPIQRLILGMTRLKPGLLLLKFLCLLQTLLISP